MNASRSLSILLLVALAGVAAAARYDFQGVYLDFYDNAQCQSPNDPALKAASKQHLWTFSYEWPDMDSSELKDSYAYGITPADTTDPLYGQKIDSCTTNGKTARNTLSGRCVSTLGSIGEANKNNFYRWGADKFSGFTFEKHQEWKYDPYWKVTCVPASGAKFNPDDESTWNIASVKVEVFAGYDGAGLGKRSKTDDAKAYKPSEPKWAAKKSEDEGNWRGQSVDTAAKYAGAYFGAWKATGAKQADFGVGRYRCCAENDGTKCTKYGWDFKKDGGDQVIAEKDRCKVWTNTKAFSNAVSPVTGINYATAGNSFTVAHNTCTAVPGATTPRWVIARCNMEWRENRV